MPTTHRHTSACILPREAGRGAHAQRPHVVTRLAACRGRMAGQFPQVAASWPRQRTAARMPIACVVGETREVILHRRRMHTHTSERRGSCTLYSQRYVTHQIAARAVAGGRWDTCILIHHVDADLTLTKKWLSFDPSRWLRSGPPSPPCCGRAVGGRGEKGVWCGGR